MRGTIQAHPDFLTVINLNHCVPVDHPLRAIRGHVDAVLKKLSPLFAELYADDDRASIPPEQFFMGGIFKMRCGNGGNGRPIVDSDPLWVAWCPPHSVRAGFLAGSRRRFTPLLPVAPSAVKCSSLVQPSPRRLRAYGSSSSRWHNSITGASIIFARECGVRSLAEGYAVESQRPVGGGRINELILAGTGLGRRPDFFPSHQIGSRPNTVSRI